MDTWKLSWVFKLWLLCKRNIWNLFARISIFFRNHILNLHVLPGCQQYVVQFYHATSLSYKLSAYICSGVKMCRCWPTLSALTMPYPLLYEHKSDRYSLGTPNHQHQPEALYWHLFDRVITSHKVVMVAIVRVHKYIKRRISASSSTCLSIIMPLLAASCRVVNSNKLRDQSNHL